MFCDGAKGSAAAVRPPVEGMVKFIDDHCGVLGVEPICVDKPMPGPSAIPRRVRPLVSASRTAARRNSGVGPLPLPMEHLLVPQLALRTFRASPAGQRDAARSAPRNQSLIGQSNQLVFWGIRPFGREGDRSSARPIQRDSCRPRLRSHHRLAGFWSSTTAA
jgi:hypothetical protein